MQRDSRPRRRGFVYILALLFLSLFGALSVALSHASALEMRKSRNHANSFSARMAAESGLSLALYKLRGCQSAGVVNGAPDMLQGVYDHLAARMGDYPVSLVEYNPDDPDSYRHVSAGPIALGDSAGSFSFELHETDTLSTVDDPSEYEEGEIPPQLQLIVSGRSQGVTRRVGVRFNVALDKEILNYAISSTCRVIARANVRVHGPISCSYSRTPHPTNSSVRNNSVFPLDISLAAGGSIDGSIGTTMSEEDFIGDPALGDTDFYNGVQEDMRDRIVFDEAETMDLDPDDFDTSPLKAMTSMANLPVADAGDSEWQGWGADPDDPSKPALENICVPEGTNPVFRNCTFKGITYIEVDEQTDCPASWNQNYVQFIDCTFEGPIITGVPKEMDWNKNKITFSGNTVFRPTMIQEALGGVTLMAPNFNVNIGADEGGGGEGESYVVGLLIGGCVDLYNDLTVHGTVVSMAKLVNDEGECIMDKPDSWVATSGACGANLGNLDGQGSEIDIYPDPDNVLPLGIKRRYIPCALTDTYIEFTE